MRMRVSLLRDQSIIDKLEEQERKYQAEKRAKEAAAKVFTPTQADGDDTPEAPSQPSATPATKVPPASEHPKIDHPTTHHTTPAKLRIRPLSEAKAIDRGANFISELFLFSVAGGLILFEALRARRKEQDRRDTVKERLELLEERKRQDDERINQLEEIVWKLQGGKEEERRKFVSSPLWSEAPPRKFSWTSWMPWESNEESPAKEEAKDVKEDSKASTTPKIEAHKETQPKAALKTASIGKTADTGAADISKVKRD